MCLPPQGIVENIMYANDISFIETQIYRSGEIKVDYLSQAGVICPGNIKPKRSFTFTCLEAGSEIASVPR